MPVIVFVPMFPTAIVKWESPFLSGPKAYALLWTRLCYVNLSRGFRNTGTPVTQ